MSERVSTLQMAEREIARGLLEGPERDFFEGFGSAIVCDDQGEVQTEIDKALAEIGLCIVIKVLRGPIGGAGNLVQWDAAVRIGETVPTHRTDGWDGKAADVVADAVLRAFAMGGAFRPKHMDNDKDEDGNPLIEITGTTWVATPGPACGPIPPLPPFPGGLPTSAAPQSETQE